MPSHTRFLALLLVAALAGHGGAEGPLPRIRLRLSPSPAQAEKSPPPAHANGVTTVVYSADGKYLLTGGGDGTLAIWDAKTGQLNRRLGVPGGWVCQSAFSPDSRYVAAAGYGGSHATAVSIWDIHTGKILHQLDGHTNGSRSVTFTPDGRWLASGGFDGYLRIWDLTSGKRIHELTAHRDGVPSLACTPDSKILASVGYDGQVRLWDLSTGVLIRQFISHEGSSLYAVAFSADGRLLAVGGDGGGVRVYELLTGAEVAHLTGHSGLVHSLTFHRNGRRLVTGSYDKTARLWRIRQEREERIIQGHQDWVWGVALSSDGRALATASKDGSTLVWEDLPSSGTIPWRSEYEEPELSFLWTALGDEDARRAYRAVEALGGNPNQAVAFLQTALTPAVFAERPNPARVAQLLKDLDDDDFEVREKASVSLRKLGSSIAGDLRKLLAAQPSPEVQRRIETLLETFRYTVVSEERRRWARALHVLEEAGTPAARRLLDRLVGGDPESAFTQEARIVRDRLTRTQPPH